METPGSKRASAAVLALALGVSLVAGSGGHGWAAEIDPAVFKARRARLVASIGGKGLAILYGKTRIRTDDEQDSTFWYLTGVEEAGAALILAPEERVDREFLFLRNRDPEAERWSGERPPIDAALRGKLGFGKIYRTGRLGWLASRLATRSDHLAFLGPVVGFESAVPRELKVLRDIAGRVPGVSIKPFFNAIAGLRSVKEPRELELMRLAIRHTSAGHDAVAAYIKPGVQEYDAKTVIEDAFRKDGARRRAFPSIVGSGPNSTVLHYRDDSRTMKAGELVVVDIGANHASYASDITRTYPVGGRFEGEARTIYEIVLAAQQAAIKKVRPGAYLSDVHAAAAKIVREAGYGDYFLHNTSHYVGLDVHDIGDDARPLEAGMVITVEPGIYFRKGDRKIGVRIEDMVLVTRAGREVMTEHLPREPAEVERWMAEGRR